jgi:serine/threonine protein kinase
MAVLGGGSINLTQFGWDNVIIPANLAHICRYLPKWHQLKILREPQVHGHHVVHFPHYYFYDMSGGHYMPALEKGDLHNDNGGYSQIFKAQRSIYKPEGDTLGNVHMVRKTPFEEICIKEIGLRVESASDEKEFIEEINAILYEAYLHALLDVTLDRAGLRGFVPHLHDVVALSISGEIVTSPVQIDTIWMTMEFMDGCTLEKYIGYKFRNGTMAANTQLLTEILYQLAHVLNVLQTQLLFNHRDLKINNLYVRVHTADPDWKKTLVIPSIGTIECHTDLVLIDFGFSCIACGSGFRNPRSTLLGAGSFFRTEDDCLKKGRDLAQFLYSLHCAYPLQNYVAKPLFDMIHAAMHAERRGRMMTRTYDLFMGLDAVGTPYIHSRLPASIKYNDGIYHFLKDNTVDVPGCEPARILAALHTAGA